jgi:hypothetical protein
LKRAMKSHMHIGMGRIGDWSITHLISSVIQQVRQPWTYRWKVGGPTYSTSKLWVSNLSKHIQISELLLPELLLANRDPPKGNGLAAYKGVSTQSLAKFVLGVWSLHCSKTSHRTSRCS